MTSDNHTNILRPADWEDFIGQEQVKKSLQISILAAQSRQETLDHILLYGPPGLGKTTLSHIVARSLGVNIQVTSGPALTRVGDLASILTNLKTGDVLFIDEIHRLNKSVEEALYPVMEDYCLDMVLGKGPGARTVRLELEKFTLVGATTKIGNISSPLRDRFGLVHRLKFYLPDDLQKLLLIAAKKLEFILDEDSALEIARRSRGTARIALKLLKRVRDYSQVEHHQHPNLQITKQSLEFYQVDTEGLDEIDRRLLEAIIKDHNGGPVGLKTIATILSEDVNTVSDFYEPFLIQAGFLSKTHRGRIATPKAYKHLKLSPNS